MLAPKLKWIPTSRNWKVMAHLKLRREAILGMAGIRDYLLQQRRISLLPHPLANINKGEYPSFHIHWQTIWPLHIHRQAGRQSASDDQGELSKTNALLHTLLKRIERQDKKISDMQSKLSQSSTVSSASTESTPRRRSASDRRKEVPLEIRVSPQGYIVTCTYMYHMCIFINIYRGRLEEFTICLQRTKTFLGGN